METIIAPDSPTIEPTLADLRAMTATPAPTEAKGPEASAAPADPATPTPKAVSEPADKQSEPEPKEEPLPEGVQKRIAKEAEKAARIQSEIDRAVSNRKAKEAELSKLTADSGTAPVKNAETAAATGKPTKPEFGKEGQTWGDYQKDLAKYDADHEAWLMSETEKKVEARFRDRQQQESAAQRRAEAVKTLTEAGTVKNEQEFVTLTGKVAESAPEGLQLAISSLDNWAGVAVHLAKAPDKLAELAAEFERNPYKAVATLGRIEASLKSQPKQAAAEPLPKPPKLVGGGASASPAAFDWENAPMSSLKAEVNRIRSAR